jgi:ABC-type histidine transport system ATPase subunit
MSGPGKDDIILRVEDLHEHFGRLHVLRGISLTVRRGEVGQRDDRPARGAGPAPPGGRAPGNGRELVAGVLRVMKQLADDGMTMIVVTHELDFARSVGDRVVMFDHGLIIEEAPPAEIFTRARQDRTRRFLQQLRHEEEAVKA